MDMFFKETYPEHTAQNIPSTNPPITVLPDLPRPSRAHRYHPYLPEVLYRPHLLPNRSPSPRQVRVHISCLPHEILALIFTYLDTKDKGAVAQVCSSWREASYRKSVWRNVEAKLHIPGSRPNSSVIKSLTRRGIKKVQILSLRKSFRELAQNVGHLTSLNLSGCYYINDESIEDAFVPPIPSLLHLDVSLCKQITDRSVVLIVRSCQGLETLDLAGCSNITDAALVVISKELRRLKYLNLRSCWDITDEGIRFITGQTNESPGNPLLERLGLQDCHHLSDEALNFISLGLTNVRDLNLSFCINISDFGLKYLAKMTSLRELNLHSCDNISDSGIAFMTECNSQITSLDVSFCDKITNMSLHLISQGLLNLKCLSLRACQISNEGISQITKALSDLEVLNVGQCAYITDKSLHDIADSFKNLRYVDLYGCRSLTVKALDEVRIKLPHCNFSITLYDVK